MSRSWLYGLYPLGALLVWTPLVQVGAANWPLQLGLEDWRFGAARLLFPVLPTPLLGLLLWIAAAALLGHRRLLRFLGLAALLSAVLGLAVIGDFALNYFQVRTDIAKAARPAFDSGAIRAFAMGLLSAVFAIVLGVAVLRVSRRRGVARSGNVRLVVGGG